MEQRAHSQTHPGTEGPQRPAVVRAGHRWPRLCHEDRLWLLAHERTRGRADESQEARDNSEANQRPPSLRMESMVHPNLRTRTLLLRR